MEGPLTRAQRMHLRKMGGAEAQAVNELEQYKELLKLIYSKANVGSVPMNASDLRDILNDIAMQVRTTPNVLKED
jgi:hypothetical protein